MSFGSSLAIYFIIWWLTLFVVLPFGIKSQQESGEVSPGSDPGAPTGFNFWKVALVTSLAALVPFGAFYFFVAPLF